MRQILGFISSNYGDLLYLLYVCVVSIILVEGPTSDYRFIILVVFSIFPFLWDLFYNLIFLSFLSLCLYFHSNVFLLLLITENSEELFIWIWTLSQLFHSLPLKIPSYVTHNYSICLLYFSFHNVLDDYLNSKFWFINSLLPRSQNTICPLPLILISVSVVFHFNNLFSFSYFLILFYGCYVFHSHSEL